MKEPDKNIISTLDCEIKLQDVNYLFLLDTINFPHCKKYLLVELDNICFEKGTDHIHINYKNNLREIARSIPQTAYSYVYYKREFYSLKTEVSYKESPNRNNSLIFRYEELKNNFDPSNFELEFYKYTNE